MDLIVLIMAAFNSAACSWAKAMLRTLSAVASCICCTWHGEAVRLGSFADAGMGTVLPAEICHFFKHLTKATYMCKLHLMSVRQGVCTFSVVCQINEQDPELVHEDA